MSISSPKLFYVHYRFIASNTYMKCVVRIMVFPALCFNSRSHVPRLAYGSIPEVGSSKNTISDPPMSAIAQLWISKKGNYSSVGKQYLHSTIILKK